VTPHDAEIHSALGDLAAHVAWPDDAADVVERAVAQLAAAPAEPLGGVRRLHPLRRPRWAAAAALVASFLAVVIVAPAREAVADLLGLGGIRITVEDRPGPDAPGDRASRVDLGRSVSLDEAAQLAHAPLPVPAGVGEPDAAFAGRPVDGVTLVWRPTDSLPDVLGNGYGLLVSVFPGTVDEDVIEKRIYKGGTVEPTSVNGDPAFWIGGAPHEFEYLGADGEWRQDEISLSGNALIWTHGGITYRLESALDLPEAISLAESVPTE
jgi:hypothetical protein